MRSVDEYIDGMTSLPPAPRVLPELLALLQEEEVDSSKVVSVITYDPGLTASVLQLCNCAVFAGATPVGDLSEAVTRLGFNRVYQLVAALVGGKSLAPAQAGYGIDKGELWKHSVAAAIGAQLIAETNGDSVTLAYTATLLHDIGKIVLSEALVGTYSQLIEETERNQQSLIDAERKLLGVDHAEVGGRVLARWRFPASLVDAVAFHHAPQEAATDPRLAACAYLGNMLAHFMGYGYGHVPFAVRGRAEAFEILGLHQDAFPQFMIGTFERIATIEALLGAAR